MEGLRTKATEPQKCLERAHSGQVLEEEIASCTEIVKAFTISTGLTPRQDPTTMESLPR